MFCSKGFTTGLFTGAVIGSVVGALMDPMKDKDSKKLKKGAGTIIHSVGNIVDSVAEMRH
ncbi:MAG: hypothetical protein ACI3XA_05420 [Clostridia bacterium]